MYHFKMHFDQRGVDILWQDTFYADKVQAIFNISQKQPSNLN